LYTNPRTLARLTIFSIDNFIIAFTSSNFCIIIILYLVISNFSRYISKA
jgi:hypothetical protein